MHRHTDRNTPSARLCRRRGRRRRHRLTRVRFALSLHPRWWHPWTSRRQHTSANTAAGIDYGRKKEKKTQHSNTKHCAEKFSVRAFACSIALLLLLLRPVCYFAFARRRAICVLFHRRVCVSVCVCCALLRLRLLLRRLLLLMLARAIGNMDSRYHTGSHIASHISTSRPSNTSSSHHPRARYAMRQGSLSPVMPIEASKHSTTDEHNTHKKQIARMWLRMGLCGGSSADFLEARVCHQRVVSVAFVVVVVVVLQNRFGGTGSGSSERVQRCVLDNALFMPWGAGTHKFCNNLVARARSKLRVNCALCVGCVLIITVCSGCVLCERECALCVYVCEVCVCLLGPAVHFKLCICVFCTRKSREPSSSLRRACVAFVWCYICLYLLASRLFWSLVFCFYIQCSVFCLSVLRYENADDTDAGRATRGKCCSSDNKRSTTRC